MTVPRKPFRPKHAEGFYVWVSTARSNDAVLIQCAEMHDQLRVHRGETPLMGRGERYERHALQEALFGALENYGRCLEKRLKRLGIWKGTPPLKKYNDRVAAKAQAKLSRAEPDGPRPLVDAFGHKPN
jgi:hypothetical protein